MSETIGEKRVRTSFNPSQTDAVAQIKQKSAEIINIVNNLDSPPNPSEAVD